MKCKTDFITNSSSTCFFLRYNISLKETRCREEISKKVKEDLKKIAEKYNVAEKEKPEIEPEYGFLRNLKFLKDEESGYIEDEELATMDISIDNHGGIYDSDADVVDSSIIIDIEAKSSVLNHDPEDLYTNRLTEIIHDCLKDVPGDLELFFSQIPIEVCGDGWNSGDPMGEYSTLYQLYTEQTKIGKLKRVGNNAWKLELNKV